MKVGKNEIDRIHESRSLIRLRSPIPLAVIGGGPAGLRAAEVAASAGLKVTLYDGM